MKEIPVSEFRKTLSEVVNQVAFGGDQIVLERHGKRLAVVISVEEYDRIQNGGAAPADAWAKWQRRGETIQKQNLDHLRSLTHDHAVRDTEELLKQTPPGWKPGIPPVAIARLLKKKSRDQKR